jgi:hypothetical protein
MLSKVASLSDTISPAMIASYSRKLKRISLRASNDRFVTRRETLLRASVATTEPDWMPGIRAGV